MLRKIIKFENKSIYSELKISSSTSLLIALTKVYVFNDYKYFDDFMIVKEEENDIFSENIFLLSEKGKKEYIKKVLLELLNNSTQIDERVLNCFIILHKYRNLFPKKYDEDKYNTIVAESVYNNEKLEKHLDNLSFTENANIIDVIKKIDGYVLKKRKSLLEEKLDKLIKCESLSDLDDTLAYIRKNEFCRFNNNGSIELIPEIFNFFKKNNWLLKSMKVDMLENDWDRNKKIEYFVYDYSNMRNGFCDYLSSIYNKTRNTAEKEKVKIMLLELGAL